jgi:hypothetical protein
MVGTILTLITGGLGGSLLTIGANAIRNRVQRMQCHYIEDDVLSKVPLTREDNTIHQNLYCKRFRVTNTTNKDINEFKILFQFDSTAIITDCYSRSKEGYNKQRVRKSKDDNNQAEALVRNFNRGDCIEYTFEVANVTDNSYYVTECNCMGFKIKVKDKRKASNKSKSNRSDEILVVKH